MVFTLFSFQALNQYTLTLDDSGFDSISAVNLTAIKKKKEAVKPADFHDPARESFEEEEERQRLVEEQAKQAALFYATCINTWY